MVLSKNNLVSFVFEAKATWINSKGGFYLIRERLKNCNQKNFKFCHLIFLSITIILINIKIVQAIFGSPTENAAPQIPVQIFEDDHSSC